MWGRPQNPGKNTGTKKIASFESWKTLGKTRASSEAKLWIRILTAHTNEILFKNLLEF